MITHHPRYVESTREHEKDFIDPYYRGATNDVINRNLNQYPEVDDSYIIQNKPERVERFTERNYNPGVTEIDTRTQARSPLRKSSVNPQYRDEYNVPVGDQRVGSNNYRAETVITGGPSAGYGAGNRGGHSVGRAASLTVGQTYGAQRSQPASQYRRDSDIEDYDSELDYRGKSQGSTQNLKQAILDKKMKEERDNRRFDDF